MYVVAQLLHWAMSYLDVQSQKASVDLVPVHLLQELTPVECAHAVNKVMEKVHFAFLRKKLFCCDKVYICFCGAF